MVNYLTSPTDRAWQVACRILLGQMVNKCLDWPLAPRVENLLRRLIGKECWDEPPDVATGRFIQDGGDASAGLFHLNEIAALAEAGFVNLNQDMPIIRHQRVTIDGVRYQSRNRRVVKYNNSIAYVDAAFRGEEVHFVNIQSIVTWEHDGERRGLFGFRFINVGPAFGTSYMNIVQESEDLVYIPLSNVILPAVLVRSCGQIYISPLPNRWDND